MNRRLFLLALGSLPACAGSSLIPRPGGVSSPSSPSPLTLGRPGEVPVLLLASRGREAVLVDDPLLGPRTLALEGGLVRCSDGRRGSSLEIEPGPRGELSFDGQIYPGRLLVRARPAGGLELINLVPLEEYVEAVVSAELALWSAHHAELAAQAVCARTYALSTLTRRRASNARATLFDSTLDQAYRGRHRPGNSGHAREVARRLRVAVEATRGQVLTRGGRLEDARFHAACGGRTSSATEVFADALPGPPPVDCPPCLARAAAERAAGAPLRERPLGWSSHFDTEQLRAAARSLGIGDRVLSLEPVAIDRGGRWLRARVEGDRRALSMRMDRLRAAFGATSLKSALFTTLTPPPGERIAPSLTIGGLGRGHGVGLCQEGARDFAEGGYSFDRILAHYYPGSRLELVS